MMKDEAGGKQIIEFAGLRAKLYSYKTDKEEHQGERLGECKKCKGISKSVIKTKISFEDYKRTLETGEVQRRQMNCINSKTHEIFTQTINKIALDTNDDKRFIPPDGIHTFAWGHYKISN